MTCFFPTQLIKVTAGFLTNNNKEFAVSESLQPYNPMRVLTRGINTQHASDQVSAPPNYKDAKETCTLTVTFP